MLEKMNKADRAIVVVAFLIFATSLLLLFSDYSLFSGLARYRGEPIGYIAEQKGDVRFKSAETIAWENPQKYQNIIYNDAVFVGGGSKATAKIGSSEVEINENSLVVFRKEQENNFLNIGYGQFFGRLSKGEKFIIDNGKGSPIEITANQKSEIVFKKSNTGNIEINLKHGNTNVDINGKKVKLKPNAELRASTNTDVVSTSTPELVVDESLDSPALEIVDIVEEEVLAAPYILQPYAKEIIVRNRFEAPVNFDFQTPEKAEYLWYQIYNVYDSSAPVSENSQLSGSLALQLSDGEYRIRAAAIYPNKKTGPWTEFVAFSVRTDVPEMPLIKISPPSRIFIPNKDYHPSVYRLSEKDVSKYLNKLMPELNSYFSGLGDANVEVMSNGKLYLTEGGRLPDEFIYPGRRSFQYQLVKDDYKNSPWSDPLLLEVVLEPPRKVFSEVTKLPQPGSETAQIEVEWSRTLFADRYEVMLEAKNRKPKKLVTQSTKANLKLASNVNYRWKVRALNKRGEPISAYSAEQEEYVPYVQVIIPQLAENQPSEEKLKEEEQNRLIASEEASIKESLELNQKRYNPSGFFAWMGSGYNYVNYKQQVNNVGQFDDNNLAGPSLYAEVGYNAKNGFGALASYKDTPGEVRLKGTEVFGSKYHWTTMSIEGLFEKKASASLGGSAFYYGGRAGLQYHHVPYIHQYAPDDLALGSLATYTPSLGFTTRLNYHRMNYHWSMRYQYPISASGAGIEGFEAKTKMAFDGLVGMTYHLSERWMLGWFWYGQWHQYDLKYIEANSLLTGSQTLFYSNMDFRLGFDF